MGVRFLSDPDNPSNPHGKMHKVEVPAKAITSAPGERRFVLDLARATSAFASHAQAGRVYGQVVATLGDVLDGRPAHLPHHASWIFELDWGLQGSGSGILAVSVPGSAGKAGAGAMAEGQELSTPFILSVQGLSTAKPPLLYSFYYVDKASGERVPLTGQPSADATQKLLLPSPCSPSDPQCVTGSASTELTVLAKAVDAAGATAELTAVVRVLPAERAASALPRLSSLGYSTCSLVC